MRETTVCSKQRLYINIIQNMSLSSRTVPIRYEREWWPRTYEQEVLPTWSNFSGDPFPYGRSLRHTTDVFPTERPFTTTMERSFPMERRVQSYDHYEDRAPVQQMHGEMRRMTDEMNRMMRGLNRNTTTQTVPVMDNQQLAIPNLPSVDDWRLTENFRLDNPIKQDYDGSRKFYLQFDVRQFKPEEIHVKTSGNQLTVQARHEEKDSGKSAFREYCRQYVLPKEVRQDQLVSKLSHDGVLSIEAPLPALSGPRDRLIAIEHGK